MPYDNANQFFSFALYFYWKIDVIRAKKHENRFTLSDYRYTEVQWKSGKIMKFMHDIRMTYDNADWFFLFLSTFWTICRKSQGSQSSFSKKSWNSIRLTPQALRNRCKFLWPDLLWSWFGKFYLLDSCQSNFQK